MQKIQQVFELPMNNNYLTVPLILGEKVIVIQAEYENPYIKVRHNKGQTISEFHKLYFIPVEAKTPLLLKVKQLPSANKHLPVPLKMGEKVKVIEYIEGEQYIRIIHNKGKNCSRFNIDYFEDIN